MTESEFISLLQDHQGVIQKLLYLYVDIPDDRKDMRQEIHLQAWRAIGSFRGDAKFSTWLYRVALNTILTSKRKKRVVTTAMQDTDHEELRPQTHDKSDLLLRAIRQMSDVEKTLITLHLEDYSNEEISDLTGLSKGHVAVKIHRIKERLKQQLNPGVWTN